MVIQKKALKHSLKMDLSHRLPFPDLETFHNYFSIPNSAFLYKSCLLNNNKRVSAALEKLSSLIPRFNESECYATLVLARYTMQNSSHLVRLDSLHILFDLSQTSLCIHTIPYILLLTHDDHAQIKAEASERLQQLLKDVGGLKQCMDQLISAIGAMGSHAFNNINSEDFDQMISHSRLASCATLSSIQILKSLTKFINRKNSSELLQYLKVAINGIRIVLNDPNSALSLFYNERLRCCLYRLQQETEKLKISVKLGFDDFLKETNPQCIKLISILMTTAENIEWNRIVSNPLLLNNFVDDFIANTTIEDCSKSLHLLNEENTLKMVDYLISQDHINMIDFKYLSTIPQIWENLPQGVLMKTIQITDVVDAKYVIQFSSFFDSVEQISLSSDYSDVSEAFLLIGKPKEIETFVQKFPHSIISTIKKWTKSPKTDWYVPSLDLRSLTIDDSDVISEIIPEDQKSNFESIVKSILIDKIEKGEDISESLWRHIDFDDQLCKLIVEKKIEIKTDEITKQKHYQKVFEIIESSANDADAGVIIGKISKSVKVHSAFPKTRSLEFMENFFNEVELNDAPIDVEIEFLQRYLARSFPNFEITLLMGTFSIDRLSHSVSLFLSKITDDKRQSLVHTSIESTLYNVALFLIATTSNTLDIPYIEYFAPFLLKLSIYNSWISEFSSRNSFVNFLNNPEDSSLLVDKDHPYFLFASALSHLYDSQLIYAICRDKIDHANSLYFFLILKSLTNVEMVPDKYPEMLLSILSAIPSLPNLNSIILNQLELFFSFSSQLSNQELFDLLSKSSVLLSSSILQCLKTAAPLYLDKIDYHEWVSLRNALARGPVSSLSVLDETIATKFDLKQSDQFAFLIENFPHAAAKFYALTGYDHRTQEIVMRLFSVKLIPSLMKSIIDSVRSNGISINSNEQEGKIDFEISKDDDSFHLSIRIPNDYPLELPVISIGSIGKDSVTRETRDEVIREALRPNGIVCAILTWKAHIMSIMESINPCPICFSLLDQQGELPKAKCPTCHQCCHASCMKEWTANSAKKICPWCRAVWKQVRHRPKKQANSVPIGTLQSFS